MTTIETLKEMKKVGNALTRTDKGGKPLKIVTGDPFCMDKVVLDRKDVVEYIKGKATPLLGDDFYYCYKYTNGVLSFIAFVSETYEVNSVHYFVKAILEEGKYCASKPGSNVFYCIINDAKGLSVEIDYEQRENYEMLTLQGVHNDLVAAVSENETLQASWSLDKKTLNINLILIGVFALLMGCALLVSWKYQAAKASFELAKSRQIKPVAVVAKDIRLPDVVSVITRVGDVVLGKAVIERAELNDKGMQFVILFNTETVAQSFMRQFGGKYEQGKVIYSTPFSPAK